MAKEIFKKEKGFTLSELLVTLAVIGLLVSVVLVSIGGSNTKSRDARAETEIRQIAIAFEMKYTSDGYYPDLPDSATPISSGDEKLSPHLYPVPYLSGSRVYHWYNGGDNQKFCVFFEYETHPGSYFTCSYRGCYVYSSSACPGF